MNPQQRRTFALVLAVVMILGVVAGLMVPLLAAA